MAAEPALSAEYAAIGRDKRADSVSEDDLIATASNPVPTAETERRHYGGDQPCEGTIHCPRCAYAWLGTVTAASPEALADGLNRIWQEHLDAHPGHCPQGDILCPCLDEFCSCHTAPTDGEVHGP
jgi:hypothetical protein